MIKVVAIFVKSTTILPLFDHCDMSLSGALIFFINSFVTKEVAILVNSIVILPLLI